jgi:alpha-glucan, water dikinase
MFCTYLLQSIEIEIDGDYKGMLFVLCSDGAWINNNGFDFYVEFSSDATKGIKVLC